jgi:hypothetical protein
MSHDRISHSAQSTTRFGIRTHTHSLRLPSGNVASFALAFLLLPYQALCIQLASFFCPAF